MKVASSRAMRIPLAPKPVTPAVLEAYLASQISDLCPSKDSVIMIHGEPVVNIKVVDGNLIFQTHKDMLDENPPCANHNPVKHRDGKPPWCYICRLTENWELP